MVTLSSSTNEEALELLFLSPGHDTVSRVSKPSSCSGSDFFEDWPEGNDMAASVYIALTVDALSSHALTANAPRGDRESHGDSLSTRQSCSRATSSRRSHQQRPGDVGAPHGRSKRVKINAECALAAPSPHCGALFTIDFDQSEWEIMYAHFVEEGLVGPSDCKNKKSV
jgi:hypothetical protein